MTRLKRLSTPVRLALLLLLFAVPAAAAAQSQDPRDSAAQGGIERTQRGDTDNHPPHPLHEIDDATWNEVLDVNLTGRRWRCGPAAAARRSAIRP